jgi:hypothetical protein
MHVCLDCCVNLACVSCFVEQACEPTQSLCPYDPVIQISLAIYQNHYLGNFSYFKWFIFYKIKSQDLFWHKGFSKLSIYKNYRDYTLV